MNGAVVQVIRSRIAIRRKQRALGANPNRSIAAYVLLVLAVSLLSCIAITCGVGVVLSLQVSVLGNARQNDWPATDCR